MAETIFILGAGASLHAGVPVMDEFFGEAYDLYDEGKIKKEDLKHFERVIDAKSFLEKIPAKINIDLNNIETIFSLVEMGKLISKFPGCRNSEEIKELHTSFKKFIVRTIEKKTNFIYEKNPGLNSSKEYMYFCKEIIEKLEYKRSSSSCIITFNYDIALDYALELSFGPFCNDYCLNENKRSKVKKYKLIKLHGSINWAIQKNTNAVYPVSISDYIDNAKVMAMVGRILNNPSSAEGALDEIKVEISPKINQLGWIPKNNFETTPLIVPPTWTKTEYHTSLKYVWKQAAKEISNAKNIFIIGYSLPETDEFFKYLLGLGMIDIVRLKGVWVFNPNKKARDRFSNLFEKSLGARFHADPMPFQQLRAMKKIKTILKL